MVTATGGGSVRYLYALIAVLTAISVLNLLLTLGIIRRLRSRPMSRSVSYPDVLPTGAVAGEFAARDLRDRPVSRDELSGHTPGRLLLAGVLLLPGAAAGLRGRLGRLRSRTVVGRRHRRRRIGRRLPAFAGTRRPGGAAAPGRPADLGLLGQRLPDLLRRGRHRANPRRRSHHRRLVRPDARMTVDDTTRPGSAARPLCCPPPSPWPGAHPQRWWRPG
jgi:hypothetical protein